MAAAVAAAVGYAAWNPLDSGVNISVSGDSDEVCTKDSGASIWESIRATVSKSSGKLYCEFECVVGSSLIAGLCDADITMNDDIGEAGAGPGWAYFSVNGRKRHEGSAVAYGDIWTNGTYNIGLAWDAGAGLLWWSLDGVWQDGGDPAAGTGEAFSGVTGTLFPACSWFDNDGTKTCALLSDPADQTYSPPSGFSAGWFVGTPRAVVCVGDSLTAGNHVAVTDPYPDQLPGLIGSGWSSVNLGEGGARVADCQSNWTAYSGDKDVVIVACGYNNIVGDSQSAATVWAALEPLLDDVLGSATHLIVGTVNPFKGNVAKWTAQKQIDADALTALIEAYAVTNSLAVFDMAVFLEDDITADYLESDYDTGDGTHPNQLGTDRMASEATTIVGALTF